VGLEEADEVGEEEQQINHNAKKTFWISQSIRTSKYVFVSLVDGKVFHPISGTCCMQTSDVCVAVGVLKGYDQLMNLVLDNVEEHLRGTIF